MKKAVESLTLLLVSAVLLTSCLGEEEEVVKTSTVALLTFSLDDMKTTRTKKVNGRDTTYTYTTVGSRYAFTIDHSKGLVTNKDSIPYGTKVKITANVTADGYIYYEKEGERVTFSPEDSIDFSQPVVFTIVSQDERYSRDYRVIVNVHHQNPSVTYWNEVKGADFPAGLFMDQKAVTNGEWIYVYGITENDEVYVTYTAIDDGAHWTEPVALSGVDGEVDCHSVMSFDGIFYLLAEGNLYSSVDGVVWTEVSTSLTLKSLCAVAQGDSSMVWGVNENNTFVSSVDMVNWTSNGQIVDNILEGRISSLSYALKTNPNIYRTLFVGVPHESSDTCAQVWTKLSTEDNWQLMTPAVNNAYGCPLLENLTVIRYAGNLYAFGGKSLNERQVPIEAFSAFFESRDNGITWRIRESGLSLPHHFRGLDDTFSTVVVGDYIWIIWSHSGQVWQGFWRGE